MIVLILVVILSSIVGLYWVKKGRKVPGAVAIGISCYGVVAYGFITGFESADDLAAAIVFGIGGILTTIYLIAVKLGTRRKMEPGAQSPDCARDREWR